MKWWAANDSGLGWGSLDLREKTPYTEKNMLHFLFDKLPKEIVWEIALFEGRILRAFICDYVGQVYSGIYKKYFGYRYSLKYITSEPIYGRRVMYPLEFFSSWSTYYRKRFPGDVKKRKPHKFMRPYMGIIPENILNREREKFECKSVENVKTGTLHRFPMRLMYWLIDRDFPP